MYPLATRVSVLFASFAVGEKLTVDVDKIAVVVSVKVAMKR